MRHTPWPGGTRRPGTLLARYEVELGRLVDHGLAELALARGRELERLDLLMRNIVQQSFDGVVAFAEDGRVGTANPAAEAMFGLEPGGLAGRRFEQLFPDFRRFRPAGDRAGGADGRWHGRAVRPDGGTFPVELALRTIALDGESRLVAVVRDTTEAEEQQARLRHQATHDALTGLANRVLLHERLEEAVRATLRDGRPTGLLLLDLDRFKEVTTRSATTSATACCRSSRGACAAACAPGTRWPASAATSSPCCCPTAPTSRPRAASPPASPPPCASRSRSARRRWSRSG